MKEEMTYDHTLMTPYVPVALYFEEADIVEYVRRDIACVHQRVDEVLTLVLDMQTREPIGFTLKGFKNFYMRHIQPKANAEEHDFVLLTSVLEEAVGFVGDGLFDHAERQRAYAKALDIASKDEVRLRELPRAA